MNAKDQNGMQAQNWGKLDLSNSERAVSQARVDSKQEQLFKSISSVIQATAADLYGSADDPKYKSIVNLVLERVRGALKDFSLSDADQTKIALAVEKSNLSQTAELTSLLNDALDKNAVKIDTSDKKEMYDALFAYIDSAVTSILEALGKQSEVSGAEDKLKDIKAALALLTKNQKQSQQKSKTDFQKSAFEKLGKRMNQLSQMQSQLQASSQKGFKNSIETVKQVGDNLNTKMNLVMVTSLMTGMKNMMGGLMKGVGKLFTGALGLILAPIKFILGGALKLILAPLKLIFGLAGKIFGGLVSGAFNLLGGLFKSPGGLLFLGVMFAFVWKKWIAPKWNIIQGYIDRVKSWFEPFSAWANGKASFGEALKSSWDMISGDVMKGISAVSDKIKEWIFGKENTNRSWLDLIGEKLKSGFEKLVSIEIPGTKGLIGSAIKVVGSIGKWVAGIQTPSVGGATIGDVLGAIITLEIANVAAAVINLTKGVFKLGKDVFNIGKGVVSAVKSAKAAKDAATVASTVAKAGNAAKTAKTAATAAKTASTVSKGAKAAQIGKNAMKTGGRIMRGMNAANAAMEGVTAVMTYDKNESFADNWMENDEFRKAAAKSAINALGMVPGVGTVLAPVASGIIDGVSGYCETEIKKNDEFIDRMNERTTELYQTMKANGQKNLKDNLALVSQMTSFEEYVEARRQKLTAHSTDVDKFQKNRAEIAALEKEADDAWWWQGDKKRELLEKADKLRNENLKMQTELGMSWDELAYGRLKSDQQMKKDFESLKKTLAKEQSGQLAQMSAPLAKAPAIATADIEKQHLLMRQIEQMESGIDKTDKQKMSMLEELKKSVLTGNEALMKKLIELLQKDDKKSINSINLMSMSGGSNPAAMESNR